MEELDHSDGPIVDIPQLGKLRGAHGKSFWSKKPIYQFMGIKYGESPNGNRRFKKAIPAYPWDDIKDAYRPVPKCPNDSNIHIYLEEEGDRDLEDCLYLSVFSPNLSGKAPVMFYIASSGYYEDKSQKLPDFLLEEDVVLVIPNYRTGILGFLSTRTEEIPGNAGLTDIILALSWVQNYISCFGGDPNNVTIAGQSFGAALAHALLMCEEVPDHYFHRAILQSGSLLSAWAVQQEPEKDAQKIAWLGGLTKKHITVEDLNDFFMDAEMDDLLNEIWDHKYECSDYDPHEIALSKLTLGDHLCKLPTDFLNAKLKKVPVLAGVTRNDGVFAFTKVYNVLINRVDLTCKEHNSFIMLDYIRDFLGIQDASGSLISVATSQIFTQEDLVKGDFNELIHGFIDFCGTLMYKAPTFRAAQLQAMVNPESTYLYSFDYEGTIKAFYSTLTTCKLPYDCGSYHSYENRFLFPSTSLKKMSTEDLEVARMMVRLWTSFAKNGSPSAPDVIKWPAMTQVTGPVFHIDKVPFITKDFLEEFAATVKDAENGRILAYR